MGKFGNCKNSLLNYIKKEKSSNPDLNLNGKIKQSTSFHNNLKLNNSNNEMRFSGNIKDMFLKK